MASEFDAARFREAVMYVAWRMRGDEGFGRVKLAKTLFYADFEAYAGEGEAVTGAKYEHCARRRPPSSPSPRTELVALGRQRVRRTRRIRRRPRSSAL